MKTLLEAMDPVGVNNTMMKSFDLLKNIMGFGSDFKSDDEHPRYSYTVQVASGSNKQTGAGKDCATILDSISRKVITSYGGYPCARNTNNNKDREDRRILFLVSVCIPAVADRIKQLAKYNGKTLALGRFSDMYKYYEDHFHNVMRKWADNIADAMYSAVVMSSKSPAPYESDNSVDTRLDKYKAWNQNVFDTVNNIVAALGVKPYVKQEDIDLATTILSAFCVNLYLTDNAPAIVAKTDSVDYVSIIGAFLDTIAGKDKTADTYDDELDLNGDDDEEIQYVDRDQIRKTVFRKDLSKPQNTQRGEITSQTQFTGRFVIGLIAANYGALKPEKGDIEYSVSLRIARRALEKSHLMGSAGTRSDKDLVDWASERIAVQPIQKLLDIRSMLLDILHSPDFLDQMVEEFNSDDLPTKRVAKIINKLADNWLYDGMYRQTGLTVNGDRVVIASTRQPSACFGDEAYNDKNIHNSSLTTAGENANEFMVNTFNSSCVTVTDNNNVIDQIPFNQLKQLADKYVSAGTILMIGSDNIRYYGVIYGINAYSEVNENNFSDMEQPSPFVSEVSTRISTGARPAESPKIAATAKLKAIHSDTDLMRRCVKAGFLTSTSLSNVNEFIDRVSDLTTKIDGGELATIYAAGDTVVNAVNQFYVQCANTPSISQKLINSPESARSTFTMTQKNGEPVSIFEKYMPSVPDLLENSATAIENACNFIEYRCAGVLGVLDNSALLETLAQNGTAVNLKQVQRDLKTVSVSATAEKSVRVLSEKGANGQYSYDDVFTVLSTIKQVSKIVPLSESEKTTANELIGQLNIDRSVYQNGDYIKKLSAVQGSVLQSLNSVNVNASGLQERITNNLHTYLQTFADWYNANKDNPEILQSLGLVEQFAYIAANLVSWIDSTVRTGLENSAKRLTQSVTPDKYSTIIDGINNMYVNKAITSNIRPDTNVAEVGRRLKAFSRVFSLVQQAKDEIANPRKDFDDTQVTENQIPEEYILDKKPLDISDPAVASGVEQREIDSELAVEHDMDDTIVHDTDEIDDMLTTVGGYTNRVNKLNELNAYAEELRADGDNVPEVMQRNIDSLKTRLSRKDANGRPDENGKTDVERYIENHPDMANVAKAILAGTLTVHEVKLAVTVINDAEDTLDNLNKKGMKSMFDKDMVAYAYTMSDLTSIAQAIYTIGGHVFTETPDVRSEADDLASEMNAVYRIVSNRSGNPLSMRVIGQAFKSIGEIKFGETSVSDDVLFATTLVKLILMMGRFTISDKSKYSEYLSGKNGIKHVGLKQEVDENGNPLPAKDDAIDALARTQVAYGQTEHNQVELSDDEKASRLEYVNAVRSEMKDNPDLAKYAFSIGMALNHFDYTLTDPRFSKSTRIERMYNSLERSSGKGMLLGSTKSGDKIASNYLQMEILNAVIDDEQSGNGGNSGSYPSVKRVVAALMQGQPIEGYAKNYTNQYSKYGGYSSRIRQPHFIDTDPTALNKTTGAKFTVDQIFSQLNPTYDGKVTDLGADGLPTDECVKSVVRAARNLVYVNITRNIGKINEITSDVELDSKYTGRAAKEAVLSLDRLTNDLDTPISYIIVATMHLGSKAGREALVSSAEKVLTEKGGSENADIDEMAYVSDITGVFPQKMTDVMSVADDAWINTVVHIISQIPEDMTNAEVRECLSMYNGSGLTSRRMIQNSGNYTQMYKIFSRLEQINPDIGVNAGFYGDTSTVRKETIDEIFKFVLADNVDGNTDAEKRNGQLAKILDEFTESRNSGSSRLSFHGVSPTEAARMQIAHMRMNPNSITPNMDYDEMVNVMNDLYSTGYITRASKANVALKYPGVVLDLNTFKYFLNQVPTEALSDPKAIERNLDLIISSHLTGIPMECFDMLLSMNIGLNDVDEADLHKIVETYVDSMYITDIGPLPDVVVWPIVHKLHELGEVSPETFKAFVDSMRENPNRKVSYWLKDIEHGGDQTADAPQPPEPAKPVPVKKNPAPKDGTGNGRKGSGKIAAGKKTVIPKAKPVQVSDANAEDDDDDSFVVEVYGADQQPTTNTISVERDDTSEPEAEPEAAPKVKPKPAKKEKSGSPVKRKGKTVVSEEPPQPKSDIVEVSDDFYG